MMYRAAVLIPFHRSETDTDCLPGDEIVVGDEELSRIRRVNINMVDVLEEVEEPAAEPETEPEEEPAAEPVEEPKPKKKTKKQ